MLDLNLDVDEIWKSLGTYGRYQRCQIFTLVMGGIACAFHLLSAVVIGYRYPYSCREVDLNCSDIAENCDNGSLIIEYNKCSMNIYRNDSNQTFIENRGCVNGYSYPVPKDLTFVTEWDLVCQNMAFAEFSQTLVILGQATGAAIFTQFSDRFGRKPVNIVAHVGIFCIALSMAFVQNFTVFAILRYLVGTFQQGIVMTNTVLMLETLPRKSRYIGNLVGSCAWTTGVALLAPLGYLFRNTSWRYLQLTLALYSTYSFSLYWVLEESLRWLIANGKSKEAERIIRKAARWNKVRYEDVISRARKVAEENELFTTRTSKSEVDKAENDTNQNEGNSADNILTAKEVIPKTEQVDVEGQKNEQNDVAVDNKAVVKRYTFFTILKTRKLLINSIILWYTWIVASGTYYGIALNSYTLSGNRFLNFFLTAIMDYPASFTKFLLMNRIGRKRTVIFFYLVTGISCLTASVFLTLANGNTSMLAASTAFTLIGKYGSSGSFGSIFLYTPELYPTNLRNVGLGISSTISRIGGMLAPFAGPLAERIRWAPGVIFGSMCMLVTVLCLRLPETTKYELPQTLEEMDKWTQENDKQRKQKQ